MQTKFTIAITGDSSINRRISVHTEERFLSLVKILRDADVAYTNFETVIHDYLGDDVYPSAEVSFGATWLRSPRFVADELKWAGFDLVSQATHHCMDYNYGGLIATWKALDEAGLVHAGTGRNLGEAREPSYLDTGKGRVALVSMCSSFPGGARASETRRDVQGRPGLNPLGYYYVVDANTIEMLKQHAFKLGWSITQMGKTWWFNPSTVRLTNYKFVEGDEPGVSTVADDNDAQGNLRSISDARRQADYVLVHLHTHEWDPDKGLNMPAKFVPPFAKACIDAGADVFIAQGSHPPPRGIEIYKGKPIFYDPGTFIGMRDTVTRQPADFYQVPGYGPEVRRWEATTADGYDARQALHSKSLNHSHGSLSSQLVSGSVVAVCSWGEGGGLDELRLYPINLVRQPRSRSGIPMLASGETAEKIIEYVGQLSAPFGVEIEFKDGIGLVKL